MTVDMGTFWFISFIQWDSDNKVTALDKDALMPIGKFYQMVIFMRPCVPFCIYFDIKKLLRLLKKIEHLWECLKFLFSFLKPGAGRGESLLSASVIF